jgi:DnaJ-class molecular chaperone
MSTVQICKHCEGEGEVRRWEDGGRDWSFVKCTNCGGTGKVRISTFQLTTPHNYDITKLSAAQTKIFDVIRQTEKDAKDSSN